MQILPAKTTNLQWSIFMIACPVCETNAGSYILNVVNNYNIHKCHGCGLEYTSPNPTNKDLELFYSSYLDVRASEDIVRLNAEKNIALLEKYGLNRKSSYVLDFGCGNGEFVEIYGSNCYGIELKPNPLCDRIKSSLEELPLEKFDCITLWGVLEHLNDIQGIMSKLSTVLKKNGILVITTVNAEGLIPFYHKPPEHLTYWTRKSFDILGNNYGYDIIGYMNYEMYQYSSIYLDRLLSRTPKEYKAAIMEANLPEIITIPTNEIFVVYQKKS